MAWEQLLLFDFLKNFGIMLVEKDLQHLATIRPINFKQVN